VTATTRLSLPDLFTSLIEGLFKDVSAVPALAWLGWVNIPVIKLLWRRLRRMSRLFASILAQLEAGTLPAPVSAPRRAAPVVPAPDRPAAASQPPHGPYEPPPTGQPGRYGWVLQITYATMIRRFDLIEMLDDPETAEIVAKAPQLGRVLRPLCQMLALKPPAWLRLPRRARRVVEHPPAPDWLVNEPGAELRADGSVWMRLGASTKWKPGFWQTLEEAQKFDKPVRIWPR
jgi:hypothetical protein